MMAMLSFSTIGGLSAHLSSCKKIRQNIAVSNNRDGTISPGLNSCAITVLRNKANPSMM
jgi:hypothetical protein